jgi:glycosyltransferase involved in cell wall biosynthesis
LLATSRNKVAEERKVTKLIQSRYQAFFTENNLEDICRRRISAFKVDLRKNHIEVRNPLGRQRSGKRILCFFPHLEVGGADKFNLDLLTLLADRGYDITIATTLRSEHPWHHHFYQISPDIFHLPSLLSESYWLDFTRYIIESRQIDVVFISNCYVAYYFLPILRAEFLDIAFVDYTHIYDPGWRGSGYPRASCQFSRFLDSQVVASKHLAEFYQSLNPQTRDKLRTCYINIDVNKWVFEPQKRQEIRSSLGIADDTVVLLFPARIVAQKRPLFLVDLVKELVDRSLPILVITLGSGYLLPEMRAKIAQLGLESVFQALPPVDPEKMLDFYSATDICLLPSEYEGISLAVYEAMSMQLPVVTSDVGGQAELVTPETGFLIPKGKGDANETQQYLKVLVPLIKDAKLRRQVGSLARERVAESFSLEKMGDRMEAILTEAIKLRQTAPQQECDLAIAQEMLTLALEYTCLEEEWNWLYWRFNDISQPKQDLQQLQEQTQQLQVRIEAMESSKFWKLRKLWFKIKRQLGLTQEEP